MQRAIFLSLLVAIGWAASCQRLIPAFAQAGQHATYRIVFDKNDGIIIYLPDETFTRGAVRTTDVKEVCSETTKQFRKTTKKMKQEVDREYGVSPNETKNYERDHSIPLELGGADEIQNLWPQPYPQAHWKDSVENWLRREVCAGRRDLVESQRAIASNWYELFLEMNSGPRPTEKEDRERDQPAKASQ